MERGDLDPGRHRHAGHLRSARRPPAPPTSIPTNRQNKRSNPERQKHGAVASEATGHESFPNTRPAKPVRRGGQVRSRTGIALCSPGRVSQRTKETTVKIATSQKAALNSKEYTHAPGTLRPSTYLGPSPVPVPNLMMSPVVSETTTVLVPHLGLTPLANPLSATRIADLRTNLTRIRRC